MMDFIEVSLLAFERTFSKLDSECTGTLKPWTFQLQLANPGIFHDHQQT